MTVLRIVVCSLFAIATATPQHQISATPVRGTASDDFVDLLGSKARSVHYYSEFEPFCLKYIKGAIKMIDENYGDAQLETTLKNECIHSQEFPHSIKTGFLSHDSCTQFARDIQQARDEENNSWHLHGGSTQGYHKFCTNFYEHHGGFNAQAQPEVREEAVRSRATKRGIAIVLAAVVATLALEAGGGIMADRQQFQKYP